MANTPQPRSWQQIRQDMVDTFLARSGVDDLNAGSVLNSLFDAAAQSDFRNSQDTFAILDANSLDRAKGAVLDRLAQDEDTPRRTASAATGAVTLLDYSFDKVATKVYPGTAAPNTGTVLLNVVDASAFPASGSIYIGRGTPNVEGPIPYTVNPLTAAYWTVTLGSGTSRFHNLSETVVLAQGGNRAVPAGTVVQTPGSDAYAPVKFTTTIAVVIPSGEDTLTNVPVVAMEPGTRSNVPRGTIGEVAGNPYPNAGATNPLPFSTAQDQESDDQLRERVRSAVQSRSRGTPLAIETAAVGTVAPDEPKRVVSAAVVEFSDTPATLFIDDGTGYEEISAGVGQTNVVDSALGGEQFTQLPDSVIARACLVSTMGEPFALYGNERLSVDVGGDRSEHVFLASDFLSPGAATAFEVASSVNADPALAFSASTSGGGKYLRVFAKADSREDLQVAAPTVGTDANGSLGLPGAATFTLMLYKNDAVLYKDGLIPTVETRDHSLWSPTIADGDTVEIVVDGKTVAAVLGDDTYAIRDADFVAAGTGYSTVSASNSLQSWADVINARIPGVTATVSGGVVEVASNKGADDGASVEVVGGTLVAKDMFAAGLSSGQRSDYALNRNTGQIRLASALLAGDRVTAGSLFTRGYVEGAAIPGASVTLAAPANLYVLVDGAAAAVDSAAYVGTTLTVSGPAGSVWRYTSSDANAFVDVAAGDWMVVVDTAVAAANRGYWRVSRAAASYVEVERSGGTAAGYVLAGAGLGRGVAFARSAAPMQRITVAAGAYSTAAVVSLINAAIIGAAATADTAGRIRITTLAHGPDGGVSVVAADTDGGLLLLPGNQPSDNLQSHTAYAESGNSELGTPHFFDELVAAGTAVEPPLTVSTTSGIAALGADANSMLGFLRPFGANRYSSNRLNYTQLGNIGPAATLLTLRPKATVHEVLTASDRVFAAAPFDLNSADTLVVTVDGDPAGKTFTVPMGRRVTVNSIAPGLFTPTPTQFNAYDTDAGPTGDLEATFGSSFGFGDYKVWMRSRGVLGVATENNALVVRHPVFGPTGNAVRAGVFYPTAPSLAVSSVVSTGQYTSVGVVLPSGPKRVLAHDLTTTFSVGVAAGPPDTVTYTYAAGTPPLFLTGGDAVVAGDIFTVGPGSSLDPRNEGTFRVTGVTDTSLTCLRPAGAALADGAKAINAADNLQVYPLAPAPGPLASAVKAYIDASLPAWLEASATSEGLTGAVSMSTLDSDGYSAAAGAKYRQLVDGEDWVLASDLTGAVPQFTLKAPLSLSHTLYTLDGEVAYLVPTSARAVSEYVNTLGVSGLSTLAGFSTADRGGRLQVYSDVVGTAGAVEVAGGTANASYGSVLDSGAVVDASYTMVRIPYSARHGFHAGQYVRATSTAVQPKVVGVTSATTGQVAAGATTSTVTIAVAGSYMTARAHSGVAGTQLQVERHGAYTFVVWNGTGADPVFGTTVEGDWVTLGAAFAAANQGTFRVVRRHGSGLFVENENSVEEVATLTAAFATEVRIVSYDSVLPGDSLVLGPVLGPANQGVWEVDSVTSPTVLVVKGVMSNIGPIPFGAGYPQFQAVERVPFGAVKRIHAMAQNPADPAQLDVTLDGVSLPSKMNVSAGTALSAEGKLGFATGVSVGVDGYKRSAGLVAEVNRVVYGDPRNSSVYPGVRAAGALLNIQGPLVRGVGVSLTVRVKTGVPFSQVADKIRSAVAAAVNSLGIGQPVVISSLVSAAGAVDGVLAVSVSSPAYSSTSDLIAVQSFEKPMVLNAASDIIVSQVGG